MPLPPFWVSFGLPIVNRTYKPDSFMRFTTSPCAIPEISTRLTAIIRSPTFNSPQRSAGLPGISLPSNTNYTRVDNIEMEIQYILLLQVSKIEHSPIVEP